MRREGERLTDLLHNLVLVAAEAIQHVQSGGELTVTVGQVVDHLRSIGFSVCRRRLQLVTVAVHDVDAVLLQSLHVADQSLQDARRLPIHHSSVIPSVQLS